MKERHLKRRLNCYYCEKQIVENKNMREQKGNEIILNCGSCLPKQKKFITLLKREVDKCQQV